MRQITRAAYLLGSLWEIIRFLFLFTAVTVLINPSGNPVINLLVLWLAAGQVCGALIFFLIWYFPEKFFPMRKILAVYKFIGILPALIVVSAGIFLPRTLSVLSAETPPVMTVPAVLVFIDSLFLFFLLFSSKTGRIGSESAEKTLQNPDIQETRIEET